jgi:hypothetical protein
MKRWLMLVSALTTTMVLATGLAVAQPKADCKNRADVPEKVEGQVTAVDQKSGRVTIRDTKGGTHEFQASKETLQDMKPGDRIEAKLREAPKC